MICGSIPATADPVKLTVEKAEALFQALNTGLGGTPVPGSPGAAPVPYKLTATATYAIAINVSRLEPVVKAYQAAYKAEAIAIAKEHSDDVSKGSAPGSALFVANSPAQLEFGEHMDVLWSGPQSEQTLDLMRIKLSDLNIGPDPSKQNQISPSVIAALALIIDP